MAGRQIYQGEPRRKRREAISAEELATDGWRGELTGREVVSEEMLLSLEGRVKVVGGSS